jgi:hypothetical protein
MRLLTLLAVCLWLSFAGVTAQAADISEADLKQHSWCYIRAKTMIIRMQFLGGGSLNQAEFSLDGGLRRSYLAEWEFDPGAGKPKLTRSYRDTATRGNRIVTVAELSSNSDKSISMTLPNTSGGTYATKLVMCDGDVSEKLFN